MFGDRGDAEGRGSDPGDVPTESSNPGTSAYLEFVGGSAAKFYAAVLETGDDGTWRVAFNFGRIGYPREWARKVDGVDETKARSVFLELIGEKQRKGYERRPWPAYLATPTGERPSEGRAPAEAGPRGIYVAAVPGRLPTEASPVVSGVRLPSGYLLRPQGEGGSRGEGPVLWISDSPVKNVTELWKPLARAFPDTGIWPLIVDARYGIDAMPDRLMDVPRSVGADPYALLRRWWHESAGMDEDEFDDEAFAPFGRKFPGLAVRSPGRRPSSIEPFVHGLEGHLGLVAVERPARTLEAIGWMGPANYDMNPTEQSAILDTWEDRFDAYLVGLGTDTITLVVARPPADFQAALQISAEHFAFCSDNIVQGAGSIAEYAPLLVRSNRWDFWWD